MKFLNVFKFPFDLDHFTSLPRLNVKNATCLQSQTSINIFKDAHRFSRTTLQSGVYAIEK